MPWTKAQAALDSGSFERTTLQEYADAHGYGEDFLRFYLLPMSSAVWSTPFDQVRAFPAMTLLRFFRNHGLLGGLSGQHQWLTVAGGAKTYVDKMTRGFRDRIHLALATTHDDSIASWGDRDYQVPIHLGPAQVRGRRLGDVVQDAAEYLFWSQTDIAFVIGALEPHADELGLADEADVYVGGVYPSTLLVDLAAVRTIRVCQVAYTKHEPAGEVTPDG